MTQLSEHKEERTEILYGAEDAVNRGIKFMSNVKKQMDVCFDSKGLSMVIEIDAYRNGYIDIRRRGGKIRAKNNEDSGATLAFSLPVVNEHSGQSSEA